MLTAFAAGSATTVLTEDGEKRQLSASESAAVVECNPASLDARIDDLVNISDLNEMSILHILRNRFRQNLICECRNVVAWPGLAWPFFAPPPLDICIYCPLPPAQTRASPPS